MTKTTTPLLKKYLEEHKDSYTVNQEVLDKKLSSIEFRYTTCPSQHQLQKFYKSLHLALEGSIELDKQGYKLVPQKSKHCRSTYSVSYIKPETLQTQEIQELKDKATAEYLDKLETVKQDLINDLTATIQAEKEQELEAKKEAEREALYTEIRSLL